MLGILPEDLCGRGIIGPCEKEKATLDPHGIQSQQRRIEVSAYVKGFYSNYFINFGRPEVVQSAPSQYYNVSENSSDLIA